MASIVATARALFREGAGLCQERAPSSTATGELPARSAQTRSKRWESPVTSNLCRGLVCSCGNLGAQPHGRCGMNTSRLVDAPPGETLQTRTLTCRSEPGLISYELKPFWAGSRALARRASAEDGQFEGRMGCMLTRCNPGRLLSGRRGTDRMTEDPRNAPRLR